VTTAESWRIERKDTAIEAKLRVRGATELLGGVDVENGLSINGSPIASTDLADVSSGTYTPTVTALTNLDSVTAAAHFWIRVGSVVHVSGAATADATAIGNATYGVSLPVASNLASPFDAAGVATNGPVAAVGDIVGDSTNDRVTVRLNATSAAATAVRHVWSYTII
jgi:hypothetical protein